jgi:hypothetical protein
MGVNPCGQKWTLQRTPPRPGGFDEKRALPSLAVEAAEQFRLAAQPIFLIGKADGAR